MNSDNCRYNKFACTLINFQQNMYTTVPEKKHEKMLHGVIVWRPIFTVKMGCAGEYHSVVLVLLHSGRGPWQAAVLHRDC